MAGTGVLSKQSLELIMPSFIAGVEKKYLNPASIDLPLSDEAYRLESIFLPLPGENVRDLLPIVGAIRHDLTHHLEVNVPYLIRVDGTWELPPSVYAYANPKSSTGRVNLFCRIVADRVDMYDALIGPGWQGEFWVLARPESFPILLTPGLSVAQVRLFDGKTFLDTLELATAIKDYGLVFDERGRRFPKGKLRQHAEAFLLTLDVQEDFGYECRGTQKVLDFGKINEYEASDFFVPLKAVGGRYQLRKEGFYILSTRERISVPPHLSAELRAIDPRLGEFRSHAAGYIDPGWGWGNNGEVHGNPITLEVIPRENMLVRHGQAVARLRYEKMREIPETLYAAASSHYVQQSGARLSKHFKLA